MSKRTRTTAPTHGYSGRPAQRQGSLTPTYADRDQVTRAWLANTHAVGPHEGRRVHLLGRYTFLAPLPQAR